MEPEFQTETASFKVVHALSPVANHAQIKFSRIKDVHGKLSRATGVLVGGSRHPELGGETAPQRSRISRHQVRWPRRQLSGSFPSSNSIRMRQVGEASVEVDTSCTLGRILNMEQFGKFIEIGVVVVTQMYASYEKHKNLSLGLLGAIFAVYVMELWVMPSCKVKWKVIIFRIISNFTKLLSFYLLLCILKPEWLRWCRFVLVSIIATACACSDELNVTSQNASALYQDIKTKFTWCCKKSVIVINCMIEKVLKPRKDQASPASAPPRASV